MKVVILGATGMIGSAMFSQISLRDDWTTVGVVRDLAKARLLGPKLFHACRSGYDFQNPHDLARLAVELRPDVIINCIGLTKHVAEGGSPAQAITINSVLPHRMADICSALGIRFIHISTDCVFAGDRGNYSEGDTPDATDLYGKSKAIGEVGGANVLTLRTSTIGHELGTRHGLLEWFLSTKGTCKGYRRAIFSGISNSELGRVLRDFVLVNHKISGLYHISSEPIDKASLLALIADVYHIDTTIIPADDLIINRSLNGSLFAKVTGYVVPTWPKIISSMQEHCLKFKFGVNNV